MMRAFSLKVLLAALAGAVGGFAQTSVLTADAITLNPAGGTVTLTSTTTFTGSAVFDMTVIVPAGWRYVSGSGEPDIKPNPGDEVSLSWLGFSPLPSPVNFSFTLTYPAGTNATAITASVTLRLGNIPIFLTPAPLAFGPPTITATPASQIVAVGAAAVFSVTATGGAPLSYQWRKDNVAIPDATSATLTLASAQSADAGSYTVVVTNSAGFVTSTAVSLTVVAPNHSADTDLNWRLSLIETTRVIEFYNTRNGTTRTGCYYEQAGSEDGFALDPARDGTAVVTLARYHFADSDRNGKISLQELTRVIELYNYRSDTVRTGQYHVQAGTEDGFAPGP